MRPSKKPLPQSFLAKKKTILDQLSVPVSDYDDLSPKGSIDVGIRDLIDEINRTEGCVTTSSCSGRVSVFLEGKKRTDGEVLDDQRKEGNGIGGERAEPDEAHITGDESEARETTAGVGGKGGGGRWLYVSHNPIEINQHDRVGGIAGLLGMEELHGDLPHDAGSRFIHFKFEPMVRLRPVNLHLQ
jgi:tRNA wybutosine-synthesizing protein 3